MSTGWRADSSGVIGSALARLGIAADGEAFVRALAARAPVGVFLADRLGNCLYANDRMRELTGLQLAQMLGTGWREALHPDEAGSILTGWAAAIRGGSAFVQAQRYVRPRGDVVWVEKTVSPIHNAEGDLTGWAGVCVDVTDRHESEKRYHDLVENARDAIYTADPTGRLLSANRAAEEVSGYSREELLGMSLFDLIAPEELERAGELLARALAGFGGETIEMELLAKDGHRIWAEARYRAVGENGQIVRFEGIARETTERHTLQEQLSHQAFHDQLTGLPNRALLVDRLGHALAGAERLGKRVAVMLLDLDNFKLVNDSLGHDVGDSLLGAIAPRLLESVRTGDTVARLGGDEFAFVVESFRDERELADLAKRIVDAFERPFEAGGGVHRVTASLGIAVAHGGETAAGVLRNADTAMYSAKAARRGGFELFDDGMRRRLVRELELRDGLADAIEKEALELYFQPILSLADGGVLALEALVRWPHPEWGWVQPTEFIPVAESDRLIVSLGRFVLGQAIARAADWHACYPGALPLGVFVNVSPTELAAPDFVHFVASTLETHGLASDRLGIEVTERVFIGERDRQAGDSLAALAEMGVRISLDDFGTGYSALASLKRFPFTALKIDRFFIRAIRGPEDEAPISRAIVSLGRSLGLTVIAEGVETAVQAERLRRLGCDAAQGFHFARPQPAAAVAAYLEEPRARVRTAAG